MGHVGAELCPDVLVTEQKRSRIYREHNRRGLTARLITISGRAGILPPQSDISRLFRSPAELTLELRAAHPDASPPQCFSTSLPQTASPLSSLARIPGTAEVRRTRVNPPAPAPVQPGPSVPVTNLQIKRPTSQKTASTTGSTSSDAALRREPRQSNATDAALQSP